MNSHKSYDIKRNMTINDMASFETPSKKIKLDVDAEWDDVDDLDEITVEEFDALELQATQQLANEERNHLNYMETQKNEIYALEGKIKLQSDLLKKREEELNNERVLKDNLLSKSKEEFEQKQKVLKERIENLQTSLEFKERDLLHEQEKVQALKQKIEGLKKNGVSIPSQQSSGSSRNQFLNKFDFGKRDKKTADSSVQTNQRLSFGKKYQLSLISPRGNQQGEDVLSSLLISHQQSGLFHLSNYQSFSKLPEEFNCITSNIARLGANLENENVWEEYERLLAHHISFLRNASFLNQKCDLDTTQMNPGHLSTMNVLTPFQSAEIGHRHNIIIQCLKDLRRLLSWRCPQVVTSPLSNALEHYEQVKQQVEQEMSACSAPLFNFSEIPNQEPPCLISLLALSKKETYPEFYDNKKEEIFFALSALSSWSYHSPASLIPHVYRLSMHPLLSGQLDLPCALASLKLLTHIVIMNGFKDVLHQEDNCILTSIASLCHTVRNATPEDSTALLNLVECFLCSVVANLGTSELQNEKCQCSSQVVQGFILMLWHHFQILNFTLSICGIQILKKGIATLYLLSTVVKNFREKRLPVEYQYVTLICGLSKLIRERKDLKFLHDIIRELWDFQDDGDEFESDEPSATQSILSYKELHL